MVASTLPILTVNPDETDITITRIRWSGPTLDKFRELSRKDDLVVFSPAMPPLEPPRLDSLGRQTTIDPFEHFCRAVARRHPRIRHVPYVPVVGMTDFHWHFMQNVKAVVVVIAKPIGVSPRHAIASIEDQERFAQMAINETRDQPGNLSVPPAALLLCGTDGSIDVDDYNVVLHCESYARTVLQVAARTLFP